MTFLSVAARADAPDPAEWLVDTAKLVGTETDGAHLYVVAELPEDALDEQFGRLPEHRQVARGETLTILHAALCAADATATATDLVFRVMAERGEDDLSVTVRGLESLRDRLRTLDIDEYGETEAALLDEALDLIRTHALPEFHPLANL